MPSQKTGWVTAAQSPAGPLSGSGKLRVSGESAGREEGRTGCQHPPLWVKGTPDGHQRPSRHPPWSWVWQRPAMHTLGSDSMEAVGSCFSVSLLQPKLALSITLALSYVLSPGMSTLTPGSPTQQS